MADKETVLVQDLNAVRVGVVREHRIKGQTYKFTGNLNDRVEMPFDHAIPLIDNDGFEVRKHDGTILRPKRQTQTDLSGSVINLRSDQTIAGYDELRKDALVDRANRLGAEFRHNSRAEDVITFLMTYDDQPTVAAGPKAAPGDLAESVQDDEDLGLEEEG